LHAVARDGWGSGQHQAAHAREARHQLDPDVAAERPSEDDGLADLEPLEKLDGRICQSRPGVAPGRLRCVARPAVSGQVEDDEAGALCPTSLQLAFEDVPSYPVA